MVAESVRPTELAPFLGEEPYMLKLSSAYGDGSAARQSARPRSRSGTWCTLKKCSPRL